MPGRRTDYTANLALTASTGALRTDLARAKRLYADFGRSVNRQFAGLAKGAALAGAAAVAGLAAGAKNAADAADEIAKSARSVGIATEAFQELTFAITRAGGNTQQAEKAIRRMQQVLAGISGASYARVFEELNLSLETLTEQAPDQAFLTVVRRLGEVENATKRSALAADLFGARYARAITNLTGSLPTLERELRRIRAQGSIIDDATAQAAESVKDAIDDLTLAIRTGYQRAILVAVNRNADFDSSMRELGEAVEAATKRLIQIVQTVYEFRIEIGYVLAAWATWKAAMFAVGVIATLTKFARVITSIAVAMGALALRSLAAIAPIALIVAGVTGALVGLGKLLELGTRDDSGRGIISRAYDGSLLEGLVERVRGWMGDIFGSMQEVIDSFLGRIPDLAGDAAAGAVELPNVAVEGEQPRRGVTVYDDASQVGPFPATRAQEQVAEAGRAAIDGFQTSMGEALRTLDFSDIAKSTADALHRSITDSFAETITDNIVKPFVDSVVGSLQAGLSNFGSGGLGGDFLGSALSSIGTFFGFQDGGRVPGPEGAARLIVAHGGEVVAPPQDFASLVRGAGGVTVNLTVQGDPDGQTLRALRRNAREAAAIIGASA